MAGVHADQPKFVKTDIPGFYRGARRYHRRRTGANRDLTPRERKALKALGEGKSIAQAAREAGWKNPDNLGRLLHPRPSQPKRQGAALRKAFYALMERRGLTDRQLLAPIADGLHATMPRWNAKRERFQEFKDHPTRLAASKMGLELKGAFPKADERGPLVSVTINTNLDDPVESDEFTVTVPAQAQRTGEPDA